MADDVKAKRGKAIESDRRLPHTVRFSDQEWDELSAEANVDGLETSTFVRLAALQKMRAAKKRR